MKVFSVVLAVILSISGVAQAQSESKNDQLFMAVQMQDTYGVLKAIIAGADVNYIESGRPIISWAAQGGNAFIVQSLVKAGAKTDIPDQIGQTPLMRAIETQYPNVVRVLLKAKADPNAKDTEGESCLMMAVKSRKPEIVQAIINAGADVNALTPDGDSAALVAAQDGMPESLEIIRILGNAKANMNISNIIYTPLSYAVDQGNKELVQALLSAGADANAKTNYGTVPIQRALDKPEIVDLLLKSKADPNIVLDSGSTPLIQAIENGYTDSAKLLLEAGANPQMTGSYGGTPIEVAEQYSRTDIVDLLKAKLPQESYPTDGTQFAGNPIAADSGAPGCTIVDAAKMQMELHGLLQEQVTAGKMSSDIFRTFNEDTKEYGDMLANNNPAAACQLFARLRAKYGV